MKQPIWIVDNGTAEPTVRHVAEAEIVDKGWIVDGVFVTQSIPDRLVFTSEIEFRSYMLAGYAVRLEAAQAEVRRLKGEMKRLEPFSGNDMGLVS